MMRTIGILGGMGPEATVLLMQKVIAAVPARDEADHIPLIVDQNPQVPSRIAHLIEGTGADPAPVLVAMARRLEGAGALALAMPCNTAHHYLDTIRAAVSVPVLDMVAASALAVRALAGEGARVGLLASPAVAKVGLFDRALAAEGLEVIHPAAGADLLAAIRTIKAEGPVAPARGALLRASEALFKDGAEVQLIACTEFSLMADAVAPGVTGIDTLDVLVGEIVAFARASA
jgi:aspartate racemase